MKKIGLIELLDGTIISQVVQELLVYESTLIQVLQFFDCRKIFVKFKSKPGLEGEC